MVSALACCLLVGTVGSAGAADTGPDQTGTVARVADPIAGQYIVTLHTADPAAVEAQAAELSRGHHGRVLDVYPESLHGFAVPDNPTDDEAAAARHWQALTDLYGAALA